MSYSLLHVVIAWKQALLRAVNPLPLLFAFVTMRPLYGSVCAAQEKSDLPSLLFFRIIEERRDLLSVRRGGSICEGDGNLQCHEYMRL